jgi:Protein of unknown function (DUF1592)/Protein of unknown function (DUF1588)/Protein of unknown function (DUF1585)/Protein of unknown function (DUF1587)/Protein of unknown function (DUF1595)/Planctomycete cytochrome C
VILKLQARELAGIVLGLALLSSRGETAAVPVRPFLDEYCLDCHDADMKKGGLDMTALPDALTNASTFATWVRIHDRVEAGEMPPKKKARPDPTKRAAFTAALSSSLLKADQERVAREGRATQRRLNRYEYENTLRDLLSLPYLEVKEFLPEDSVAHGFNKLGDALDVSYVQMSRYLSGAEFALRLAMAPQATRPETTTNRYDTWDQRAFFGKIKLGGPKNRRTFPLVGLELQRDLMEQAKPRPPRTTDPKRREAEAMAVVVSTYEPTEIRFDRFRAPVAGKYRLKFSAYSIWMGPKFTEVTAGRRSEPVTIYADTPPRLLRKLGSFDVEPEPTVREMDVWLLAGETIRPDAARFFRSRPPEHKNPLARPDGMPGLAFQWMEVEGPLIDAWPPPGHRLLFGDLPMEDRPAPKTQGRRAAPAGVEVISRHPDEDAARLLRGFMNRAYRRPVRAGEVERFLAVIQGAERAGYSFTDAMLAGYTAVLSSPGFLYFEEKPGRLDDRALAERLSYFLWNSCPDKALRQCAEKGKLHQPEVLRRQMERLLGDARSRRFVDAFLDYWLDLRLIAGTAPDTELYPDYQLDDLLVESMTEETQLFFAEMLQRDLGITNLVASNFAVLNERLATHYGLPQVEGVALRPVSLPAESARGGLLTQASVLKVTANGTTTSPVKRGAWIMTRLLGKPPPPPPASVPAVEPDIRGATTIREQLAKHRTQESCNACHRNIDPAGFALESFDVMGAWRDRYRALGGGEAVHGIGHNGLSFHFHLGPEVDSSGELPDGRKFRNVRELKELLAQDPEQLARNMVQQLIIYATGAPIQYSDRPQVEKILAEARPVGYGLRTLVREIVQSDLFLNK